jgi:glutathione S-transferase
LEGQAQEYLYRSRGGSDQFAPPVGEEAVQKLAEAREKWDGLAQFLELNGGEERAGPFMMGDNITFVDFAVGGMLFALHRSEGDEGKIWQEVMKWYNGKWSRYWKEIDAIIEKKPAGLT